MLHAFKIKEFDLEPIYELWDKPPRFYGDSKKDMPVDDFLRQIKAGCIERKVPEESWHIVGQHYMGKKANMRLEELKCVMAKLNGGKYRWSWKKFSTAMRNMGWEIDANATTPVPVSSGYFWVPRKKSMKEKEGPHEEEVSSIVEIPSQTPPKQGRPNPIKMLSDSAIVVAAAAVKHRRTPTRADSSASTLTTSTIASNHTVTSHHAVISTSPPPDETAGTTVSNAPTWLLNACHALNYLGTEHPRAMTTLSAVLITAGTLPAIPAISGGTILATGVAQAVGAIAVGVGNMLKAQQGGQLQATSQHTPSTL